MPGYLSARGAYLAIDSAGEAIAFYKKAFGGTERMRIDAPGGKIGPIAAY